MANNSFPTGATVSEVGENKIETVDLASLDTVIACDKGFELELKHPTTGRALNQFITIRGRDSKILTDLARERAEDRQRQAITAERRGETLPPLNSDELEDRGVEYLVVGTMGWRNINFGGPLEFSISNCKRLYKEQIWVRRQVDSAMGNLENFI